MQTRTHACTKESMHESTHACVHDACAHESTHARMHPCMHARTCARPNARMDSMNADESAARHRSNLAVGVDALSRTSSSKAEEDLRGAFEEMDRDVNAVLDRSEIRVAMHTLGRSEAEIEAVLARVTKTRLNFEEFKEVVMAETTAHDVFWGNHYARQVFRHVCRPVCRHVCLDVFWGNHYARQVPDQL